jgi:hypothetical protein
MIVAYSLTDMTGMKGEKYILFCSKIHLPLPLNFWAISLAEISY